MEQRLKEELLHARQCFRSIAGQLQHQVLVAKVGAKTSGSRRVAWAEIEKQLPSVCSECHAIAELANQWLRSDQTPTANEWATFMRRVHRISAITETWDEGLS
jgi:hypothetical protein